MDNVDDRMNVKPPRTDLNPASQQSNQVSGATGTGTTPAQKSTGVGGDTVTFTNTASEMLKLEESLSKLPDVNNARVASIKASIDEGSYQIDASKIVDSLLKIEKDMR